MKHKIFGALLCLCFAFSSLGLLAQAPQSFSYQGIYRDAIGLPNSNDTIDVKVELCTDPNCDVVFPVYCEDHLGIVTNEFGLFSLDVGTGALCFSNGNEFGNLVWSGQDHYMRVTIDNTIFPIEKIAAVPYALYARDEDHDPTNEIQGLEWNSNTGELTISNQGSSSVSINVNDGDNNPSNEIQSLTINQDQISIEGENTITLPIRWNENTATMSSGQGSLTITHGLGRKPRKNKDFRKNTGFFFFIKP